MSRLALYARTLLAAALIGVWVALSFDRLSFADLLAGLRSGRPLPPALGDPALAERIVDRWLGILPPWGMGRCLKRSLILLGLWSRSGLDTRLCLAVHPEAARGDYRAHAWLVTGDAWAPSAEPGTETEGVFVF